MQGRQQYPTGTISGIWILLRSSAYRHADRGPRQPFYPFVNKAVFQKVAPWFCWVFDRPGHDLSRAWLYRFGEEKPVFHLRGFGKIHPPPAAASGIQSGIYRPK